MTGRPQASDWHHGPDLACRPGLSPGKCRVRGPRPTNCAGWFGRLDQDFCSWWCPVMAADRVISLTTALAVSEGVATAAVLV